MSERPYPDREPRDLGGTDVVTARAALRQRIIGDDAENLIDTYMRALAERFRYYAEKTSGLGEVEAREAEGLRESADLLDSWCLSPVSGEEKTG